MQLLFYSKICTTVSQHFCILLMTVAVLCSYRVFGSTELSGSIGGKKFSAEEGPFIVVKDIAVPEGESATIGEGCQFFFKPYTGILVDGTLIVSGTQNSPVVFSAINDSLSPDRKEQLANPFDWNGILVTAKAENVSLAHFIISYSTYGIQAKSKSLQIDKGVFRQNGQYHFTIQDKIMPVTDNIPYSSYSSGVVNVLNEPLPVKTGKRKEKSAFVKKGVPAIIGAAGVGSGIVSLVFLGKWFDLRDSFRKEIDPDRREDIEDDGKRASQIAAGTGGVSIAAIATGAVFFWWCNFREEKRAEVQPLYVPGGGGVAVTVKIK